jgi:plastocyanin
MTGNIRKRGRAMKRIRYAIAAGAAALALVVAAAPVNAAAPTKLTATVGPGFTISLKKAGKKVTTLKPGAYSITVQDKSDFHNFHLTGPGRLNRKTTVAEVRTRTWNVTFRRGTYRYVCDPHASSMKGSFSVR